jgi:hypothetical protein
VVCDLWICARTGGLQELVNPNAPIFRDTAMHKHIAALSNQFHRFELNKPSPLFISVHNKTLSVVAMRVSNPDRSPLGIARDVWKRHA